MSNVNDFACDPFSDVVVVNIDVYGSSMNRVKAHKGWEIEIKT